MNGLIQSTVHANFLVIREQKRRHLLPFESISWFKADGQYTHIFCSRRSPIISSKKLGDFENMVCKEKFCRIHRSYMVNLQYIVEYIDKGRYGVIVLSDGLELNVAYKHRSNFLHKWFAFRTVPRQRAHQVFDALINSTVAQTH